jgi:hypothetical protein
VSDEQDRVIEAIRRIAVPAPASLRARIEAIRRAAVSAPPALRARIEASERERQAQPDIDL